MMYYTIYQITCKTTGKIYIGKHKTDDLNDGYMGSGKLLYYAKKKYGIENFEKTILHLFDTEQEMNDKEKSLVTEDFCKREDTYNICPGGTGGWGYINSSGKNGTKKGVQKRIEKFNNDPDFLKETYAKSENTKKLKYGENYRGLLNKDWRDKNPDFMREISLVGTKKAWTEEARAKRAETYKKTKFQQGEKNSQYGTCWIYHPELMLSKKINKDDISFWLGNGWQKGRKINKNT